MVGSPKPLDRNSGALTLVPMDEAHDEWSLVSNVAIWRSRCSLTEPLQKDKDNNVLATIMRQNKSLQVVFPARTTDHTWANKLLLYIVFARLFLYHDHCIQSIV